MVMTFLFLFFEKLKGGNNVMRVRTSGLTKSGKLLTGKGVVVYNQRTVDSRVPKLLATPAKLRFVIVDCLALKEFIHLVPYLGYNSYKCNCRWHDTENDYLSLIFGSERNDGPVWAFCEICGTKASVFRAVDIVILSEEPPLHSQDLIEDIKRQCEECDITAIEDF